MSEDKNFEPISILLKSSAKKTAPVYAWQDLALRVIKELNIPDFKRSAVFKACKENPKVFIEKCLNDTKELCKTGVKWKYFFKVVGSQGKGVSPNFKKI